MIASLLALALTVADPNGFLPPRATPFRASAATPASPGRAPSAPSPLRGEDRGEGPSATTKPILSLPSSGFALDALILPVAALLALALAALVATRRKRQGHCLVQVLETTSLGPKRTLVVARVGEEILVLGASEAGLQLLSARPAAPDALATATELMPARARLRPVPDPTPEEPSAAPTEPAREPEPDGSRPTRRLRALLGRLRGRPAATGPLDEIPAFEALLTESAEDQELRRKLALGQAGSVR